MKKVRILRISIHTTSNHFFFLGRSLTDNFDSQKVNIPNNSLAKITNIVTCC